jgi:DNA-binding XRE family transcriptional regulator
MAVTMNQVKLSTAQRDTLMKNMCSNLSVFRAKLDISQDDLATKIGVTRQTISAFESGQRKMPWSIFLALVLLFFRNQLTKRMLVALEIYTPELDAFLTINTE